MSEFVTVMASLASLAVSGISLLFTVAAYRRLDTEAHEAFAVIGADEGNHEARLERLETTAGLSVLPSPSAIEAMEPMNSESATLCLEPAFVDEFENTELQGSVEPHHLDTFEGEGGSLGVIRGD